MVVLSRLPVERVRYAMEVCGWKCVPVPGDAICSFDTVAPPEAASGISRLCALELVAARSIDNHQVSDGSAENTSVVAAAALVVSLATVVSDHFVHQSASHLLHAVHCDSAAVVIDAIDSPLWRHSIIARLSSQANVFSVDVNSCCFGGSSPTALRLVTNIPYMREVASTCRHLHVCDGIGRNYHRPGHEFEQIPTSPQTGAVLLDLAIVIPLTWWAAEVSHCHPPVAATIMPEECGERPSCDVDAWWVECASISDILAKLGRAEPKSRVPASSFWSFSGQSSSAAVECAASVPPSVPVVWPQEAIAKAVTKMFSRVGPECAFSVPGGYPER